MTRDQAVAAFLTDAGLGDAAPRLLAGDASNRRYLRLDRDDRHLVVMDAPPDRGEDVRPFIAMTEWLRDHGLSAPEIYAQDIANGLLLIEDLGDALFARHLVGVSDHEAELYGAAIDLLAHLADCPPPSHIGTGAARVPLDPYDMTVLQREACLVTDWWIPGVTGQPASADLVADYSATIGSVAATVGACADTTVLRDYHAENLIWLPDRAGLAKTGLLDYQDALAGHAAYDLVSLLEDARRDTGPELQDAMISRYLDRRPGLDATAFRAAYAVLGAQRNLKIIGIFARLALRDAKPAYLALIPRVWGHLLRDLQHPDLAPLAAWVKRNMPVPEKVALDTVARRVAA